MNLARVADPIRVVIIDDTEDLRLLLRLALERGGIEVIGEAGDGRAGIEVVRADPPDVVLLDLSMPVMDGLEALPHLRKFAPEARIVVLSGFDATHMAERAVANGADGYLQKGMPLARILDRVREFAATERAPKAPALHLAPALVDGRGDEADDTESRQAAFALAPFGILEVDPEEPFRVRAVNAAATELIGASPSPGVPLTTLLPHLTQLVRTHLATGKDLFTTHGGPRDLRVAVREAPYSLLLYVEEADGEIEALRRIMATTAHEIRGPVTVLTALAETIEEYDGTIDRAQRAGLMASVARQTRLLESITGDLLVNAQLERGALRIDVQSLQPAEVIETVLADHPVPVSLEIHDARAVLADPLRLEQMLGNLVRNALKYGRAPVVVRVRANATNDSLVDIDVQDSGDGVPEDFHPQLFGEFARAHGTALGGVGLGLHVVRSLAEAHGGSVRYATAPDGGAVFTVSLPAA